MRRTTNTVIGVLLLGAVVWAAVVLLTRRDEQPLRAGDTGSGIRESTNAVSDRTAGQTAWQKKFHWSEIESSDYRRYVANLRSIGCPPQTLVDIVTADVNSLFKVRATNALNGILKTNRYAYWRSPMFYMTNRLPSAISADELRQLNTERIALLKILLEGEPFDESLSWAPPIATETDLRLKFTYLPADKREPVRLIFEEMSKKSQALFAAGSSPSELTRQLPILANEYRNRIAAVLSPAELDLFYRYNSPEAIRTRDDYGVTELNEDEFNKIVLARIEFETKYGGIHAGSSPEEVAQRRAAQDVLDTSVRNLLGDDRYQESIRLKDGAYQSILRFAQNNGVSQEAAVELYSVKKQAENAASSVRLDPSASATAKTESLRQIRNETMAEIRRVLGVSGSESYLPGASWVRQLESPEVNERAMPGQFKWRSRVVREGER